MVEDIVPVYDRAKNQIYDDFQRMKRQGNKFLISRKSEKKYALKHFKFKFLNFYDEIYIQKKYSTFEKEFRNSLDSYYSDISTISTDEDIMKIMAISMQIMKHFNITNIYFDRDKFAIR